MNDIKKAIEYASANPNTAFASELRSRMENGSLNAELEQAGIKPPSSNGGALSNIKQDIKETGTAIKETFQEGKQKMEGALNATIDNPNGGIVTDIKALGQAFGAGAGTLSKIGGEVIKGGAKVLAPEVVEQGAQKAIEAVAKPIAESEPIQMLMERYNGLDDDSKRSVDALLGVGSLITDFATLGAGKVAKEAVAPVIKEGLETAVGATKNAVKEGVESTVNKGFEVTSKAVKKLKAPEKTKSQAVGQVTQALPKDAKAVERAMTQIDTTGVETYSDFAKKIKDTVPTLAKKVDDELEKDSKSYLLKELAVKTTSEGGKSVKTNYVEKAIKDLAELYTKIGDNTNAQNARETMVKAMTTGLRKKEVNDLARTYGQEFGEKAFGKTGDALTSVNAQAFENTRSGLKDTARQGLGKEAQAIDKQLSDVYTLQRYNDKMVDAVSKLSNRINERGLGEKIGHYVTKYGDVLTGGTLRGLVGGLLPRGVGNKVLNALDLEEALKANLAIINKAIDAKTDDALITAVKGISTAKNSMFSDAVKTKKK
jgi:cytochrome c553